jgi:hypothetical protein
VRPRSPSDPANRAHFLPEWRRLVATVPALVAFFLGIANETRNEDLEKPKQCVFIGNFANYTVSG